VTARLAITLALLASVGCGWRAGMGAPDGVRSVGVEIFSVDRTVLERGLAPDLHRELSQAVSDLVGAPLAAPEAADLVVRGTIDDYRRRSGIRNRDNELVETGVRIVIEAELAERSSGRRIGRRTSSRVWSGYGLDDSGNEADARSRALRYLAQGIVIDLFGSAATAEPPPPAEPEVPRGGTVEPPRD